jgi:LacI family transcriptional regulator
MNRRIYEIALFLPPTPGYLSDVVSGVQEYARSAANWSVEVCSSLLIAEASVVGWRPDGILLNAVDGEWGPLIRRLKLPTVQIGGNALGDVPQVRTDNEAIGALAAKYLLDRGFKNFAYFGYSGIEWAQIRKRAFTSALAERNIQCSAYDEDIGVIHSRNITGSIAKWVASLPSPVAVLSCHDRAAMILGHACSHLGLEVPEQVAILGVDNNIFECGFTNPPISSIMGSARRIGYQAAVTLDALMRREKIDRTPTLVKPAGVETRASTDIFAVSDPDVAEALRYIDEHAEEAILVEDVARAVFASRRMLERKFKALLHHSPRELIMRSHLEHSKRLLIHTDLSMLDVAVRSGFPSGSKFSAVFKREIGVGPREFRRLYGAIRPASR